MKSRGGVLVRLVYPWRTLLTWPNVCRASALVALIYAVATGLGYAVAIGVVPGAASGGPIGGDFAAFYAAGRLVLTGEGGSLYNAARVTAIQQAATGGLIPELYVPFRNPPFFALIFAPFGAVDLVSSFGVWVLVSLGLLATAVTLGIRSVPDRPWNWRHVALVVAGFAPVYYGLVDGQNATLSLLLYVLLYRALRNGREAEAGLWAAFGIFKPQLFFVFPLIFAVSRRWKALGIYCAVTLGLALVSLAVTGLDGLLGWTRIIIDFEGGNAARFAGRMHSLTGFWNLLLPEQPWVALGFSALCGIGLLALLVRCWWAEGASQRDLALRFALTVVVAVLVDAHLLDYDLSVLVLAGLLILSVVPDAPWWLLALYVLLLVDAPLPVGPLNVQLSVPLLVAAAGRLYWRLERRPERRLVILEASVRRTAHAA